MEVWFTAWSNWHIVLLVFLLMTSNGFFSAPPSELTWGLAGFAVASDRAPLFETLCAGVAGNVLGTLILYEIARRWGKPTVRRILSFNPVLRDGIMTGIFYVFERFGGMVVLYGRCLPVVRSVISIPAGIAELPRLRFVSYTAIGCTIWAILWGALGMTLGDRIATFVREGKVFLLILTAVLLIIGYRWLKRRTLALLSESENSIQRFQQS